jgi:hypothetical protein
VESRPALAAMLALPPCLASPRSRPVSPTLRDPVLPSRRAPVLLGRAPLLCALLTTGS